MKKYMLVALAMLTPSYAYAEEGNFPGTLWVNVTGPYHGNQENGNWVVSGKVTQDAVITDISDWKLSATTSIGFSKDTKGFDWNNKVVPSAGLKLSTIKNNNYFDIIVQYAHEQSLGKLTNGSQRSAGGVQVSVNYWTGWGR